MWEDIWGAGEQRCRDETEGRRRVGRPSLGANELLLSLSGVPGASYLPRSSSCRQVGSEGTRQVSFFVGIAVSLP